MLAGRPRPCCARRARDNRNMELTDGRLAALLLEQATATFELLAQAAYAA